MVADSRLTDWISLGVLTSFVPRDAVDEASAVTGRGARRSDATIPPLRALPDGSYLTVLVNPKVTGAARESLLAAARAGTPLDPAKARYARLVEHDVPDREGDGKHGALLGVPVSAGFVARPNERLAQDLAAAGFDEAISPGSTPACASCAVGHPDQRLASGQAPLSLLERSDLGARHLDDPELVDQLSHRDQPRASRQ
ncbi:hypothetical protein [Frankia tisae]|uniref:hypothetical protein n=1 Tax=Frankia tisae TaxID=2950104 RepID=UPI003F686734